MAGVSIGIFGLVVERLLLWRVRGRVLPEVLLTLGLAFILGDVTLAIWGGDPQTVRIPGLLSSSAELFGVTYPAFRLFAEGLMSAGHWAEGRPVKETQDFDDVYLKEYNQLPSYYAAATYSAAQWIAGHGEGQRQHGRPQILPRCSPWHRAGYSARSPEAGRLWQSHSHHLRPPRRAATGRKVVECARPDL